MVSVLQVQRSGLRALYGYSQVLLKEDICEHHDAGYCGFHTNRIEGAWKNAKDHFRKMSGMKITQFNDTLQK